MDLLIVLDSNLAPLPFHSHQHHSTFLAGLSGFARAIGRGAMAHRHAILVAMPLPASADVRPKRGDAAGQRRERE
jgi:hypothetical protein